MQKPETARVFPLDSAGTGASVEILNSLLQDQLAVADGFRTALATGASFVLDIVPEFYLFESDHRRAAAELREEILRLRGRPSTSAGACGAFTESYLRSASLFGARTALEALRESEEHELEELEEALSKVSPDTRRLLEDRLVPRERKHVEALGDILEHRFG